MTKQTKQSSSTELDLRLAWNEMLLQKIVDAWHHMGHQGDATFPHVNPKEQKMEIRTILCPIL